MVIDEYRQRELDVQKRFSDSILMEFFEIRPNVRWRSSHNYTEFDIALLKKELLYAIVEVKFRLDSHMLKNAKRQVTNAMQLTHCRFGIITDNNKFYIADSAISSENYNEMSFDQIVQCLIKPNAIWQSKEKNDDTREKIREVLNTYFEGDDIKLISDDINYDDNQGFFSFVNTEKEKKFFQMILGSLGVDKPVYRYTSLDTLFVMLNKGSYRMSGIVGMNDKSEIDYFDKECPIDNSGSSIRELNETYLSSCSLLKDDLTMWRLYGDDAKGVCLEFEIVATEKRYDSFILAPVNYAEKRGKHKVLEMLKELSDLNIRFAELNKWKHFFKPFDYKVEEEIRLMFIDNGRYDNGVINRDWVKTSSHSILNPVVDFKLNTSKFPLQLRRIILGPKMPEIEVNLSQMEELISQKGYSIKVDRSEIDNYR